MTAVADDRLSEHHQTSSDAGGTSQRVALGVALVPVIVLAVYQWRVGVSANLFETGTTLSGGDRALHGEALYRDVFAFYGPLSYFVPAVVVAIFGHTLYTLVVLDLVLAVLGAAVGFALVRIITKSLPAAIIAGWMMAVPGLAGQRTAIP